MKNSYNVLIIDDHPIIVAGFENALNFIAEQSDTISFKMDSAKDCKTEQEINSIHI